MSQKNQKENKKSEEARVGEYLHRLDVLKTARGQFEGQWKENEQFVSTSLYEFLETNDSTKKQLAKRFTSTPGKYMRQEAAGIVGYSASRAVAWLRLGTVNPDDIRQGSMRQWLSSAQDKLMAVLRRSNFYKQFYLAVQNGATYGHAACSIDWNNTTDRINFQTRKLGEIFLDTNEYGDIDTVYREFSFTLRQAVGFFGLESLSREKQTDWNDSADHKDEKITFVEIVAPNENWLESAEKINSKYKKYSHVFVQVDGKIIVKEDGYDDFPYACFAWEEIPDCPYGISPTEAAILDIRALNKMTEAQLKISQQSAQPPLMVPEGLSGASLNPGAQNPWTRADMKIEPIKTGENYQIVLQSLSVMEQKIKYHYDVDFFQMLAQAQSNMTATEVSERQGEKATVLGPLIENINSFLESMIVRTFNLCVEHGIIELPQSSSGFSGLKIEFTGTLAQAQKKYYATGGIMAALNECASIFQINQASSDKINWDSLVDTILDSNGVPGSCIRTDDEVKKIRDIRMQIQQQQQQQQQQQLQQQALLQNYDKLGKKAESGSPLSEVTSQLQNLTQIGGR